MTTMTLAELKAAGISPVHHYLHSLMRALSTRDDAQIAAVVAQIEAAGMTEKVQALMSAFAGAGVPPRPSN